MRTAAWPSYDSASQAARRLTPDPAGGRGQTGRTWAEFRGSQRTRPSDSDRARARSYFIRAVDWLPGVLEAPDRTGKEDAAMQGIR